MTKPKLIKRSKTCRGFKKGDFVDYTGNKCSIQKSSMIEHNAIWFGIDDPPIKMLIPGRGWVDVEIPNPNKHTILQYGRMHLTQAQVKEILPTLQHFVDTGDLP